MNEGFGLLVGLVDPLYRAPAAEVDNLPVEQLEQREPLEHLEPLEPVKPLEEEVVEPVAREYVLKLREDREYIHWKYSNPEYPTQGAPWSFDAALNHVARSNKRTLAIWKPETHSHLDQIEQLTAVSVDKIVSITFFSKEETIVDRLIRIVIERDISIEKNIIQFSYGRGGGYGDREILSVNNDYNRIRLQTITDDPDRKMYYQRMLHNIRLLRNRNLLIDVQFESAEP